MRKGFLAALMALLAGHGWVLAQPSSDPVNRDAAPPPASSSPAIKDAVLSPGCPLPQTCAPCGGGVRASGEYLLWWIKNGSVPPLVTAGGNGIPGAPGTRIVLDNLDFADDLRHGGRFALAYDFASNPSLGVEANFFFLADRENEARFLSRGDPVLGQPFVNIATSRPDATLVAAPRISQGTVSVDTRTSLWGTEGNLTTGLVRSDTFHLRALGGFRFLRLEDEVESGELFQVAPSVPGFGGNRVTLFDDFRTVNRFYGGQVGLETGAQFGPLTIDVRGKLGLGQMHQVAYVNGATHVLAPNGTTTLFPGGLYALRSNAGRHQRDELAFIPEVGLNVGLQVTQHLKLFTGYSFLWVSTVARAGDQIDPVINITQFPIQSGRGPLVGPARPALPFDGTDFWAQGLNFGLELRF